MRRVGTHGNLSLRRTEHFHAQSDDLDRFRFGVAVAQRMGRLEVAAHVAGNFDGDTRIGADVAQVYKASADNF